MTSWAWVENPAFAGKTPQRFRDGTACHDGTHFITVVCSCSYEMHIHESQLRGMNVRALVVSVCHGCGEVLEFPRGFFSGAFAQLREMGWIE